MHYFPDMKRCASRTGQEILIEIVAMGPPAPDAPTDKLKSALANLISSPVLSLTSLSRLMKLASWVFRRGRDTSVLFWGTYSCAFPVAISNREGMAISLFYNPNF
jgi:hypothetical protein